MKFNIENLWYSKNILSILLRPLSWLFRFLVLIRGSYFKLFNNRAGLGHVKIIVVGNITVGGAGKTPFVAHLAKLIKERGLNVGIISRGYGRANENDLIEVHKDSDAYEVGDEALMLKQQVLCPVVVASDRNLAARYINEKYSLDVIISDDGLQHYKLARDYEIAIVDGEREFGNGYCLPAGPLREPISRLNHVDLIISNGANDAYEHQYAIKYNKAMSLNNNETISLERFVNTKTHAIAGIGHPQRFFNMLKNSGISIVPHTFPDHHAYTQSDITFDDGLPVLMTEKDAVKCKKFNIENIWYLPITIDPNESLNKRTKELIEGII